MRALLIAGLLVLAGGGAMGQPPPAFDVASVKLSPSGTYGGTTLDAGRITMKGQMLRPLIFSAYGIPHWRLSGGPDWLESDTYDIAATFPATTPQDQVKIMLQTLLADRFKLVIHREMKDSAVYALVVAEDGPKLREAADGRHSTNNGRGHLDIHYVDLAGFATFLTAAEDRPVVDATGLKGYFDIKLDFGANDGGASIFTALQEQLGLKLESRRAPVEFIMIDHIERPLEN